MKALIIRHKNYWKNKAFALNVALGILFLLASLIINFFAGIYATEKASNPVTDIILNNIPVYNVEWIFVYGPLILWIAVAVLCLHEPKRIPFILKSIALFVLIRSVFISLTHIGPFPEQIAVDYTSRMIKNFTFGGDLFFSAHTGLPFLMALTFWKYPKLRFLFTLTAIFFGIIVLLAHVHYSIDVLSAFFITYAISDIAKFFFSKDWKIFNEGIKLN